MRELDDLFAEARRRTVEPSEALMARVLADALAEQPGAPALAPDKPLAGGDGPWAWLSGLFGGGGILAGLGTAAVAGLLVGYVQPAPVTAVAGLLLAGSSIESVDLMPSVSGLLEGE